MSGYIGVEPVTQVTKVRTFGTLVEASTTIPVAGGFSPGNIEVYINGDYVLPTDYDESDGLTIVFSITLDAGTDYVVIEARQFLVADTWSKAEADTRYAEITGGANSNFTAMPQVGGDPIVESGSNADGEWTRWADGTQTANASVGFDFGNSGATSSLTSYPFPNTFVGKPGCGLAPVATSSNSLLEDQSTMVLSNNGNRWEIRMAQSTSSFGVVSGNSLNAIGRWK